MQLVGQGDMRMTSFVKILVGIVNGSINFILWGYSFVIGAVMVNAGFMMAASAGRAGEGRGAMLDFRSSIGNPLDSLAEGLLIALLGAAFVIALRSVVKTVRGRDVRSSLAVNMKALAFAVAAFCLARGMGEWILRDSLGAMFLLILLGMVVTVLLWGAARFIPTDGVVEGHLSVGEK